MLVDYVKTTYICSTQQLNDNSLPLIPTPPLIMAVNIGATECRPLPSDPPWAAIRHYANIREHSFKLRLKLYYPGFDQSIGVQNLTVWEGATCWGRGTKRGIWQSSPKLAI